MTKLPKKAKLTPTEVAETALDIVNQNGLEGLTMRTLSNTMGVQAPVLYRLIADKRQLLDEMAEVMVSRVTIEDLGHGEPYEDIAESIRRLRRVLLAQRDGARIIGGSFSAKHNTLRTAEVMLGLMARVGLSTGRALQVMMTVFSFVLGEVLEEQGLPSYREWPDELVLSSARDVLDDPFFTRLTYDLIAESLFQFEERFEAGLALLLAGIRVEVGG